MPETPLHHVFPVLFEIHILFALAQRRLFVVRVDNQPILPGPRSTAVRGTPQSHRTWAIPINDKSEQPAVIEP